MSDKNEQREPTSAERVDGYAGDVTRATVEVGKAFRRVPDFYEILKDAELAEADRAARAIHALKCEVAALWAVLDEHATLLAAAVEARRNQYTSNP